MLSMCCGGLNTHTVNSALAPLNHSFKSYYIGAKGSVLDFQESFSSLVDI